MRGPAYSLNDALPRKHYIFPFFDYIFPPSSLSLCFLKCLVFSDIQSVKMEALEGMETAIVLLGVCSWAVWSVSKKAVKNFSSFF